MIFKREKRALDNISLQIDQGEFVYITGSSGAGKTTLLRLIYADLVPSQGVIMIADKNISRIEDSSIPYLRRNLGVVFQDYKLLPSKTVYENVAYAMEVIGADSRQVVKDVPEVLEIVGLENKTRNFPAELSGGERQRAAVARALIHRPEIILADEPTGNLDPYNTLDIMRLFQKIHNLGATIILATHNKEIINSLGKRVITLEKGKIIRDEEKGRFVL